MVSNNKEKLDIRLHVYDTDMSVTIVRSDEQYYRQAAKLITDTVNAYTSHFKATRSEKEILYMALIDIALRYEKEAERNDVQQYADTMVKLTTEIQEVLKSK